MSFTSYIMPIAAAMIIGIGLYKKIDVCDEFIAGARENLKTGVEICPALIALVTAIAILRESGTLYLISQALSPICAKIGFPDECIPLALIRPISGSGATAVFEDILRTHGADSFCGIVASVMMGSSETTFYTIAVYFSVTRVKRLKHTLFCSLLGDFVCFIASFTVVNLLFSIKI